ncbi:MAG: T9SS type A sorting domain-containing protein [Bacteroidetes bacterium]|nr:T9SS type A sorting domain-containing protein [Bacteroidota bacterium]
MDATTISRKDKETSVNECSEPLEFQPTIVQRSKNIQMEIKSLERKKGFYMKLTVLFFILNLVMIIQAMSQVVTVNGATLFNTSQITIKGDIINTAGATIVNDGTVDLSGDFINNSGSSLFGTSEGTVILNGGVQTILGNDVTVFNNLMLLGSGTKLLQQDIIVGGNTPSTSGVLSLSSQILNLNSKDIAITNSNPTAVTRTSGFIESETGPAIGYGIMKWEIENNTGNYIFPFGNSSSTAYLPVTFEVNTAGAGSNAYISVATYPTATAANPNNRPLPNGLSSLMSLSGTENAQNVVDRWWVMDAGNYTTKPVSTISLTYRDSEWDATGGSTNIITESSIQAQSNNGTVWNPIPMGFVNTSTNTVSIPNHNVYNPMWTLVASSTPLPIELLTFTVKLNSDKNVDLNWATASEINNDYFTIEKSENGTDFEPLLHVDGAGNSTSVLYYHAIDENPFEGTSYYRLKQTDFNGMYTYSEIKSVRIETKANATFQVFPNPAFDFFYVKFDSETAFKNLLIIDINGKVIKEIHTAEMDAAGDGIVKVNCDELASGMYFVSNSEGKMEKLVLQ